MKYYRIKSIQFLLPIVLIPLSTTVTAFELSIQAGNNFGGDNSIEDLKDIYDSGHPLPAGAGLSFNIGTEYPLSESSYIRALIGSVNSNIEGTELNSNNRFEVKWSHIPIDVLYFQRLNNWDFGAGLALHLNPKAIGSGFLSSINESYQPALGLQMEIDLRFTEKFYLGMKYTIINYKNNTRGSISGNSAGIAVGYSFTIDG